MPTLTIGAKTARLPIIQGGMAVRISLAPLASAVAESGGVGLIAGSGLTPAELLNEMQAARAATSGVVGANIMVAVKKFKELVHAALEGGADLIVAGAGFSRDVFVWAAERDVPVVPIVGSPRVAALAQRFGAAAVVVEGVEAGGHLGTDRPMLELLPEIIDAVDIPVIGAGGVVTGEDIKRTLDAGAAGVQMGTRFAATVESSAPQSFKQMYVDATEEDIVLVKSPVGLPGRALQNDFSRAMAEGGFPRIERCVACLKKCGKDYCIFERLERAQGGDVADGLVFAGTAAARIHDIPTVAELMHRLVSEYEATKGEG
ncbi:MAG: nitronate monooxygenase [Coriobacteriia bacterium]|jgi:NAD(P)H-dependent flavin oxidoreductase YrpB (nitropropane dioxygenase family)|nr:nitronate monooxygenase [Coriobacteriia bacterium]